MDTRYDTICNNSLTLSNAAAVCHTYITNLFKTNIKWGVLFLYKCYYLEIGINIKST